MRKMKKSTLCNHMSVVNPKSMKSFSWVKFFSSIDFGFLWSLSVKRLINASLFMVSISSRMICHFRSLKNPTDACMLFSVRHGYAGPGTILLDNWETILGCLERLVIFSPTCLSSVGLFRESLWKLEVETRYCILHDQDFFISVTCT